VFNVELVFDICGNKKLIEDSIKKYGYGVEHNYWNLKYLGGCVIRGAFFSGRRNMGLMCINYSGTWEMEKIEELKK
jgi:hypothetical protein